MSDFVQISIIPSLICGDTIFPIIGRQGVFYPDLWLMNAISPPGLSRELKSACIVHSTVSSQSMNTYRKIAITHAIHNEIYQL